MEGLLAGLEASQLSAALRRSLWLYPMVNLAHLAGLVMLVGGIGIIDLRVLGLGRSLPLRPLSRFLTPIGIAGLVMLVLSGAVMFSAEPVGLGGSRLFQVKMALVILGVVNALAYRRMFGGEDRTPVPARVMAAASLAIWLTAAGLGRWVGYT